MQKNNEMQEIKEVNANHLACVLLLDTSGSMGAVSSNEAPIDSLNRSIEAFKKEVCEDEMAKTIDVAIVKFNSTVEVVVPFMPVENMEYTPQSANGGTSMGAAIVKAIDLIKERIRFYKILGTPCFKPWIFMITDGEPTDSIEEAIRRVQEEESKGSYGKLNFIAVASPGANKEILLKITPRVIDLKDGHFDALFIWIAKSMIAISFNEPSLPYLPQNARTVDPKDPNAVWLD